MSDASGGRHEHDEDTDRGEQEKSRARGVFSRSGHDRPRDGGEGQNANRLHGVANADDRTEQPGREGIGDREVDEGNASSALDELDGIEIRERGGEARCEGMSVGHRLCPAPIRHRVQKVHDAMTELNETHDDRRRRGHGTGDGALARATKPIPDHAPILTGWRHDIR
ncbi:MAG: hypothetical protein EBY80_09050 [Actinobacteria bacterium]|nr:hypothetical protein [Actinomycetota bacterium]